MATELPDRVEMDLVHLARQIRAEMTQVIGQPISEKTLQGFQQVITTLLQDAMGDPNLPVKSHLRFDFDPATKVMSATLDPAAPDNLKALWNKVVAVRQLL